MHRWFFISSGKFLPTIFSCVLTALLSVSHLFWTSEQTHESLNVPPLFITLSSLFSFSFFSPHFHAIFQVTDSLILSSAVPNLLTLCSVFVSSYYTFSTCRSCICFYFHICCIISYCFLAPELIFKFIIGFLKFGKCIKCFKISNLCRSIFTVSWFSFINRVFLYALLSPIAICSLSMNSYLWGVPSDLGDLPCLFQVPGTLLVGTNSCQVRKLKLPGSPREGCKPIIEWSSNTISQNTSPFSFPFLLLCSVEESLWVWVWV